MIRFLSLFIPLSLLALPLAPAVEASNATQPGAVSAPSSTVLPLTVLRGVIVKVDVAKQAFVMKTKSGHKAFVKVTDKTHVRVDGQLASFDDLAPGMKARVRAKKVPGHVLFVALRVRAKN